MKRSSLDVGTVVMMLEMVGMGSRTVRGIDIM